MVCRPSRAGPLLDEAVAPPRKRRLPPWLWLAGLFLLVRLLVLLAAPYGVWDDEELFNGTAARELLRGLNLPLYDYMYHPHEGGALTMALLTVPFFKLFGTSYLVMKMPALAISLTTFLLWWRVALRSAGEPAASLLATLFILAPPLMLKSDLMLWGHHNSVGVFIAGAALLLCYSLGQTEPRTRNTRLVALGLVCGFGTFFSYTFMVALVPVLVLLALDRATRRLPTFRWFLPGCLVGFAPWVLLRAQGGFPGASLVGVRGVGGDQDLAGLVEKTSDLLLRDLPASPSFQIARERVPNLLSQLYWVLLSLAAAFGTVRWLRSWTSRRGRGPRQLLRELLEPHHLTLAFALGSCCMLVVAYCVGPFVIQYEEEVLRDHFVTYRYLLPLYPFLFFLAASAVERAGRVSSNGSWRRRTTAALTALLAILYVADLGATTRPLDLGRSSLWHGFSYERFGWRMYQKYAWERLEPGAIVDVGAALDPRHVPDYYRGLGWGIAHLGIPDAPDFAAWLDRYRVVVGAWPATYRQFAAEGLGWLITTHERAAPSVLAKVGGALHPLDRSAFYRGAGWAVGKRFQHEPIRGVPHIAGMPEPFQQDAWRGFGRALGELRGHDVATADASDLGVGKWSSAVSEGIAEAEQRIGEGRTLEGPVWMMWGPISFRDYTTTWRGRHEQLGLEADD